MDAVYLEGRDTHITVNRLLALGDPDKFQIVEKSLDRDILFVTRGESRFS